MKTKRKMIHAKINKKILLHNLRYLRKKSNAEVMVVLKANAYGHGILEMARICRQLNVTYIGVSTIDEAMQLREHGDKGRIVAWLYDIYHLKDAVDNNIDIGVFDESHIPIFSTMSKIANIHLFIDTGINRNGIPYKNAISAAQSVWENPKCKLVGIMSHLCCELNRTKTEQQFKMFQSLKDELQQLHITPEWFHISNTRGVLNYKNDFNMVRCGDGFYGLIQHPHLKPALQLSSTIVQIKQIDKNEGIGYNETYKTTHKQYIAIVPIGYADILPLAKSEQLSVYVNGTKRPVLGIVSMDQIVIASNKHDKVGDRVELFGKYQTIQTFTKKSKAVIKEMITHLSERINKEYI